MFKIIHPGGFLGKLFGPLLKIALPPPKNALTPPRLTVAASAVDTGIHKKTLVQERGH